MDFKITLEEREIEGICGQYRRPAKVMENDKEIDNPVSEETFAANILKSFVKEVVCAYEANLAGETARKAAYSKAISEIDIKCSEEKIV